MLVIGPRVLLKTLQCITNIFVIRINRFGDGKYILLTSPQNILEC